jgi:hypothetical protein
MEDSLALLQELFAAVMDAKGNGALALVAVGAMFSLRLLKVFAPGLWAKLPAKSKPFLPFLPSFAGALLVALPGGLVPALGVALMSGLGAIGLHLGSKALGTKVPPSVVLPLTPLREAALALVLDVKRPPANVLPLRKK